MSQFILPAGFVLIFVLMAWFSIRHAWWRRTKPYGQPRVLMYHMTRDPVPGARFNKMRVPPAMFRRQVEWLKREGWEFCFLSEIMENTEPAAKRVALTFDDGYRDNFMNAFPVLKEFGAKATLFPVINREDGYDWSAKKKASHDGGELGTEPKLSDDEIGVMLASGLIELGGHTISHANLPTLPDDEAWEEIHGCKAALETTFKVPVRTFCYPFGIAGEREVALARKAGYIGAVTTEQGVGNNHPFLVPRVKISGTEGMFSFRLRIRTGKRGL
jgi:peptidoglycan/xylan/chitin deacetylase (PgdA/CDA1 family)